MSNPRQEWQTPADLWEVLDAEFEFQIDVAAENYNTKCCDFLTPDIDALGSKPASDWVLGGTYRAFCNPGFANLLPWMMRAHAEAQTSPSAVVVVMGLVSPSTKWWRFCAENASEIRLLSPGVQFEPPTGSDIKSGKNSRENCVVVFRRKMEYSPSARIWTWRWR